MIEEVYHRLMINGEEGDVIRLVYDAFHEHVSPHYTQKGVEQFLGMLSPEWLIENRNSKNSFVIVATQNNSIIGMISVINKSHLALLFVDSKHQQKGIGKELINEAIGRCLKNFPAMKKITVSASPNSISFYHAYGFQPQGEEVDEDGLRFLPMEKMIELND